MQNFDPPKINIQKNVKSKFEATCIKYNEVRYCSK